MRYPTLGVRARVADPAPHSVVRSVILSLALTLAATMLAVGLGPSSAGSSTVPASASTAAPTGERLARGTAAPRYGGTVYERPGESYREAYLRVRRTYGGSLGAVRMFFPGLPARWSRIRSNVNDTSLVVSFRADPAAVLSGRHDRRLAAWFAGAPTQRRTFWSYWHEPEDDGVRARTYRRAWRHINALANRAHNPKLRSTLILMCWTLEANSGRSWRSWYPGRRVIDVMAFDCYNTGRKNGVYRDPSGLLQPAARLARSIGKPWGIAEFGSTVVESDGGEAGRAAWLREFARVVRVKGGRFATYFDSYVGHDYRLHDATSRSAWRAIVSSS